MVANASSFNEVMFTLFRVRAALNVRLEDWGKEEDEARDTLITLAFGVAATLAADAQMIFSAGRVIHALVYIPLVLLPVHLLGGVVLLGWAAWRYKGYLAKPRAVWKHPYADLLADPRWPLWRAMVYAEDQYQALEWYARSIPTGDRTHGREMAFLLLATAKVHLEMAREDEAWLRVKYDCGTSGQIYMAYHDKLLLQRVVAALNRDGDVMEAYRVAPVE